MKKKHKKTERPPKATILLVDDDDANLTILAETLGNLDYQTVAVHNGEQALEIAPDLRPDLIVMDVLMPKMDGFAACRKLKTLNETQNIPVIFMTGLSEMEKKLQGFEAGGVDYITKPFQLREVIARVGAHLTIRRQQQQLQAQNTRLQEQNVLIEQQHIQLQELNLRKDKFLSIISNDLQSPFTGIFMQTERIKRNVQTKQYEDLEYNAERLQTSVENYQNLLSNLQEWTKLQQGLLEYVPQATDIHLIVAKNIALFSPKATQKQLTLTNTCENRMTGVVDVKMLDSVIGNLLSNAIKYTEPGGNVTISAAEDTQGFKLSVADTGRGIPKDKLSSLFQIDTKPHNSGLSEENGSGLGLILCREYLEQHQGRIWVESELEKGSTFFCYLPKHRTPQLPLK